MLWSSAKFPDLSTLCAASTELPVIKPLNSEFLKVSSTFRLLHPRSQLLRSCSLTSVSHYHICHHYGCERCERQPLSSSHSHHHPTALPLPRLWLRPTLLPQSSASSFTMAYPLNPVWSLALASMSGSSQRAPKRTFFPRSLVLLAYTPSERSGRPRSVPT